ncbi:pentatricopeptide repeat-containing protein At3g26782, mitochondrial-like [Rutidosis leptorrhynchoides]|uniref:pentatricopeptide repeat-containing protein At3g26782, mitochondrial-like n=1 Tax=Rutidosis leptorrhynchoides TaxID=125765 RepID=UPI003A98F262
MVAGMLHNIQKLYSWNHFTSQISSHDALFHNGVLRLFTRPTLASIRYFISYVSKQDSHEINRILAQCEGNVTCINKMHAKIITGGYGQNVFVGSKLIGVYSELGQSYLKDARKVFDHLSERDVLLWNMMIQAYANSGLCTESLDVYNQMIVQGVGVDEYTFTFVLKACGVVKGETNGRVIHGRVMKCGLCLNVFVGNALVALYAKCQLVEACRRVFDDIPKKDVVSWNTVISGCANNGHIIEAIELFHSLLHVESCTKPDHATLVSILPACAQAAEMRLGFWIHCYTIKIGLTNDAMIESGLIAMYGNCGHLDYARNMFDQMSEKNIMVWTAMMRGYGMHGNPQEALDLFSNFLNNGLRPDGVVFLCLLSTCSHAGLVAKGREIFKLMEDYGVEKGHEHYACMVDLLGRAGLISEAVEFINTMPMLPGSDVYGALLGACRMHNNIELAEIVAEKLFVLDPNSGGRYVTMAKIYGDGGRLSDAAAVRKVMVKKNIKKPFGFSSIKVDSVVHTFGAEDERNQKTMEIFETLAKIDMVMAEPI